VFKFPTTYCIISIYTALKLGGNIIKNIFFIKNISQTFDHFFLFYCFFSSYFWSRKHQSLLLFHHIMENDKLLTLFSQHSVTVSNRLKWLVISANVPMVGFQFTSYPMTTLYPCSPKYGRMDISSVFKATF